MRAIDALHEVEDIVGAFDTHQAELRVGRPESPAMGPMSVDIIVGTVAWGHAAVCVVVPMSIRVPTVIAGMMSDSRSPVGHAIDAVSLSVASFVALETMGANSVAALVQVPVLERDNIQGDITL